MSMVDDLVTDNTKDELLEQAEERELDVNTNMNKREIATAIAEHDLGGTIDPDAVEDEEEDDTPAQPDSEHTAVRFTGKNASMHAAGHVFTRQDPFKVLKDARAEHLFKQWPDKFRPASKGEVEQFFQG